MGSVTGRTSSMLSASETSRKDRLPATAARALMPAYRSTFRRPDDHQICSGCHRGDPESYYSLRAPFGDRHGDRRVRLRNGPCPRGLRVRARSRSLASSRSRADSMEVPRKWQNAGVLQAQCRSEVTLFHMLTLVPQVAFAPPPPVSVPNLESQILAFANSICWGIASRYIYDPVHHQPREN